VKENDLKNEKEEKKEEKIKIYKKDPPKSLLCFNMKLSNRIFVISAVR